MATAVLLSGGLDSAVLLAEEAARDEVQPIYISVGLTWERAERDMTRRLLESPVFNGRVRPLVSLSVDMTDVYPAAHWSRSGQVPDYRAPDKDMYLPGRNIILLGKAGVFCAAAGIARIAIGTLDHNPFPDATPAFRDALTTALSLGLDHRLEIAAPYARVEKSDVIRRGTAAGVPLALTLSCVNPTSDSPPRHCGACNKCRERHEAFREARIADPTDYVDRQFTGMENSGK